MVCYNSSIIFESVLTITIPRLALTPSSVVGDLLNISYDVIDQFKKEKQWIIA